MTNHPTARGAVVITGASTGIGRATALALARAGYQVFAGVRRPADGAALRAAAGPAVTPLILDVTDPDSVAAAAGEVREATGTAGIAALVNNAGIGAFWPTELVPPDVLRRVFEVNVFGQVAVVQAFLPLLRAGAGRMVNIGSIGDRLTMPFSEPLGASKWAFASITEALRQELRPWGIHVVLVEPASIHSDAVAKAEAGATEVTNALVARGRTDYAAAYRTMMDHAMARERDGSSPDVVAAVIVRALAARRPRTRYLVGRNARRLALLARWLPERTFDTVRLRVLGLPTGFGTARSQPPAPEPGRADAAAA